MTPEPTRLCDATRVRIGQPRDENELFSMCVRLHRENAIFAMCEDKVRDLLRRVLAGIDGIMGVIGRPGAIEGSICLIVDYGSWYTEARALNELWNFVLPEYRRSENAKQLVEFALAAADAAKLPLQIGIVSNERTEAKIKLYERKLGPRAGAFWLHGATTGMGAENHVRV